MRPVVITPVRPRIEVASEKMRKMIFFAGDQFRTLQKKQLRIPVRIMKI